MKKLSAACFISALLFLSCNSIEPPVSSNEPELKLEFLDVSCTEAWIKISTSDISLPANIKLLKNDNLSQIINLISPDTILYVDSLLPKQTYHFKSSALNLQSAIESNEIEVNTMDTTSHNFTWQTYTFGGQAGSCVLNDVAIINANDIWAVGEIYLLDSLGQPDPLPYNAVHWDGSQWEVKRIQTIFRGSLVTVPLEGIFAFSATDIWVVGSLPIHGDGDNWTMYDLRTTVNPNLSLSKVWGCSTNDVYFVGRSGSIAHYQNGQWSKIESGTDLNINDIWGYTDNSGNQLILCAASNFGTNDQKKLLKINNNSVDTLGWTPQRTLFTLWFKSFDKLYAGGSGIFTNAGNVWKEEKSLPHNFTFRIRGNDYNDVYATGGLGYFAHFNGYSWYNLSSISLSGGDYESLDTKGNTTCVVGYSGAKAVVTIIKK